MTENIESLISQAEQALQSGDALKGAQLCEQVLSEQADNSTALYLLGTLKSQQGDLHGALQHLGRAAELEPEAVDIACNLAGVLAQLNDRKQAIMVLQRATKYCKDDPVFCPRIAEMLIHLGEPAAAVQLLSRLNVLPPQAQVILARAHGRQKQWREAVNVLQRLFDATPDSKDTAEQLANAAMHLRDYPLAIKAFERYLRLVTPTANDYLRFADMLLIAQEKNRSAQALKQAADAGEDGHDLHVLKARVARLDGDCAAALAAASEAVSRSPLNGQAWAIQAELAGKDLLLGLIAELSRILDAGQAASATPFQQAQLHYALAEMNDRLGDYSGAAESWQAANGVQQQELAQMDKAYSTSYTEEMVDYIIDEFPAGLFATSDALIEDETVAIQPIFVVGLPRSGTTLVERILGQHSQVTAGGEQEAMEYLATDFRQQLANKKLPPVDEISAQQWAALRRGYLQRLPEVSTAIFTDKMPHNFRHVGLILKMFPEARIIQMHRSPADLALSILSRAFPPAHNYSTSLMDINHFAQQGERLMQHWSSLQSSRIMDLNYEQLVTQPELYAKKLVEFCGFTWDASFLEFHESKASSFTFSELQVRQPIADKRVDRWKNYAEFLPELEQIAKPGFA